MSSNYYIGLISGTSMDAVDCALVDFQATGPKLLDFINLDIPAHLKTQLLALCKDGQNQVQKTGEADIEVGRLFAQAALSILERNQLVASQINAIGSHGQTIRHEPPRYDGINGIVNNIPFTLQIGDPNTIAELTGISTVADFRRKDMAAGGQGAPLVPAFHREIFHSQHSDRLILNIGGMSNITLLRKNRETITGFDTGPGNVLMDIWIQKHKQQEFDTNGDWAASGKVDHELLQTLLDESYFHQPPPKSTGRELFNEEWLNKKLNQLSKTLTTEDIQASLLELTSISISEAVLALVNKGELIVCGGGAHNTQLLNSLKEKLNHFEVSISGDQGLEGDSVEAVAFAWLAQQTIQRKTIDYRQITGASHPTIMGGIYYSETDTSSYT